MVSHQSTKRGKLTLSESKKFRTDFDQYTDECRAAVELTMTRLKIIKDSIEHSPVRSPFDSITSRIKSYESTTAKMQRKGLTTIEEVKAQIRDIGGIRIVVPFQDDIYAVVERLERSPGINIVEKRDYVKNPKPNGYSGFHVIAMVETYAEVSRITPIEIQVRDKAMDMWATIEHIVKYKMDDVPESAVGEFKQIADILNKFDESAMRLRDKLRPDIKNPRST